MPAQIIPVTSDPNQTILVTLNIDGGNVVPLSLLLRRSEMGGTWILQISDQNSNILLDSIPLVTGNYPAGNLLEQQAYLGIGSWFVINASGIPQDSPGPNNLGTDFIILVDDTAVET